jgi:hypothetical protein
MWETTRVTKQTKIEKEYDDLIQVFKLTNRT